MTEHYSRAQFEADKAKREEEARKEQEQLHARVRKDNQRRLWVSEGGTSASFDAAWPRIKAAMEAARQERVLGREEQARQAMSQTSRI
jgi:hypothetical protein